MNDPFGRKSNRKFVRNSTTNRGNFWVFKKKKIEHRRLLCSDWLSQGYQPDNDINNICFYGHWAHSTHQWPNFVNEIIFYVRKIKRLIQTLMDSKKKQWILQLLVVNSRIECFQLECHEYTLWIRLCGIRVWTVEFNLMNFQFLFFCACSKGVRTMLSQWISDGRASVDWIV